MDLENIKLGLRAEIKKRENEQYFTFQCNVRQMCKDVLAKLEEQEVELAEKDKEIRRQKYKRCLDKANYWVAISYHCIDDKHGQSAERHHRKWLELANKLKDEEAK